MSNAALRNAKVINIAPFFIVLQMTLEGGVRTSQPVDQYTSEEDCNVALKTLVDKFEAAAKAQTWFTFFHKDKHIVTFDTKRLVMFQFGIVKGGGPNQQE